MVKHTKSYILNLPQPFFLKEKCVMSRESVYLYVCVNVHLFKPILICWRTDWLTQSLIISLTHSPSTFPSSIHPSVHLSTHPSIRSSISPCVQPSVYKNGQIIWEIRHGGRELFIHYLTLASHLFCDGYIFDRFHVYCRVHVRRWSCQISDAVAGSFADEEIVFGNNYPSRLDCGLEDNCFKG